MKRKFWGPSSHGEMLVFNLSLNHIKLELSDLVNKIQDTQVNSNFSKTMNSFLVQVCPKYCTGYPVFYLATLPNTCAAGLVALL